MKKIFRNDHHHLPYFADQHAPNTKQNTCIKVVNRLQRRELTMTNHHMDSKRLSKFPRGREEGRHRAPVSLGHLQRTLVAPQRVLNQHSTCLHSPSEPLPTFLRSLPRRDTILLVVSQQHVATGATTTKKNKKNVSNSFKAKAFARLIHLQNVIYIYISTTPLGLI